MKQLLEYARRSEEESDHLTFLIEFTDLFEFWVNRFMQPLIKFPFKHEQPQQTLDQQQPEIHDQPKLLLPLLAERHLQQQQQLCTGHVADQGSPAVAGQGSAAAARE